MAGKREKPQDFVLKLRQVEVPQSQGKSIREAVRQIGMTVQTYYRWRKGYGGMNRDQLKRLKDLETENLRLRRDVSDLTLCNLILTEAAREAEGPRQRNYNALRAADAALIMCGRPLVYPSAGPGAYSASTDQPSAMCPAASQTKSC